MDFIERIFGVSPDGGNGSLEFFCLVSLVMVVFFVGYGLYLRRRRRASGDFASGLASSRQLSDGARGESHWNPSA